MRKGLLVVSSSISESDNNYFKKTFFFFVFKRWSYYYKSKMLTLCATQKNKIKQQIHTRQIHTPQQQKRQNKIIRKDDDGHTQLLFKQVCTMISFSSEHPVCPLSNKQLTLELRQTLISILLLSWQSTQDILERPVP